MTDLYSLEAEIQRQLLQKRIAKQRIKVEQERRKAEEADRRLQAEMKKGLEMRQSKPSERLLQADITER